MHILPKLKLLFAAAVMLGLTACGAPSTTAQQTEDPNQVLVAYSTDRVTGSNNPDASIAYVAQALARLTEGTLYDLNDTQQTTGAEYDVIYLGYGTQDGQVPPELRTFLAQIDRSDQVVIPFCTCEAQTDLTVGQEQIAQAAPQATIAADGFRIAPDELSEVRAYLSAWLEGLYTLSVIDPITDTSAIEEEV